MEALGGIALPFQKSNDVPAEGESTLTPLI